MGAKKTFDRGRKTKTFVVSTASLPGESWCGNVVWVDGRCQQQFSSMQELMELMASAIDVGETKETGKEEDVK